MKYRQWFLLALSPLLLAVALVGVRSFGGSGGVASAHVTGSPHMEIDLVKEAATEWCNPVTTSASREDVSEYSVAICLTDAPAAPAAFQFEVVYDSELNTCENEAYPTGDSLDDNPDANAGSTTFSTTNLGTGWDCNIMDIQPPDPPSEPKCDQGGAMGRAWIACMCTATGCATLPSGAGVSAPLAVLHLKAKANGEDAMKIENAAAGTSEETFITSCANPANSCFGATEDKNVDMTRVPTATPTATPTPTSTPSCGGERQDPCPTSTVTPKAWTKTPTPAPTGTPAPSEPGEPAQPPPPPPPPPSGGTMPQVVPPGTGTGSGGVAWTTSLMWTLAGAGALSVFLGGLYLRRARNR